MKKILMSGDFMLGHIGKETELYDSYGERLYTGDLVALSLYDENNPDKYEDYYGIEYICHNEFQDNGLQERTFVMGLAAAHHMYHNGEPTDDSELADYQESVVIQNHKKWRLRKVKGYENVVNGETWGAVAVRMVHVE